MLFLTFFMFWKREWSGVVKGTYCALYDIHYLGNVLVYCISEFYKMRQLPFCDGGGKKIKLLLLFLTGKGTVDAIRMNA